MKAYAVAALAVVAGIASCSTKTVPVGGLMLVMRSDGTLQPDQLRVKVTSSDGTATFRDATYAIPSEATLPTTLAIASDGDPTASVEISASVWKGGQPLDLRQDDVIEIPTERVAELDVVFSASCTPDVVLGSDGEAQSTCGAGKTCQPAGADSGAAACMSDTVNATQLATFGGEAATGADAGAGADAGVDAGAGAGAEADAGVDAGAGVDADASAGADAGADASPDGASCVDACIASATQCAPGGGAVQTCVAQPSGCTAWTTSATCGAHQTCAGAGAASACTCVATVCAQAGTTCQDGQTVATCQADGDGCLYVASTSACQSPESCSGAAPSAACSLTCTDSCSQGQTTCVSGGLATCAQGSDGCWAYGAPAACPGPRQSCTGSAGSAACTCDADPVCSSASNVCVSGSTVGNCAQDEYGCFYESSTTACGGSTTCVSGACAGVCGPGQAQCSGNTPQTCGSDGQWVSGAACSGGTPYCNEAGVCGVCQDGATQCDFNGVQTCGNDGQWGSTVACPSTAPECSNGACGQPASCQVGTAGTTNCGSASESCCASLEVPGGTYYRTYTYGDTSSYADAATVSGFRLDKYLVTVGRFRQFVTAWNGGAGWLPAAGSGKHAHLNGGQGLANSGDPGTYETGWDAMDWDSVVDPTDANLQNDSVQNYTWTSSAGSNETKPIDSVNWYEAYAFCIWDGGFLPSEAEWEYAAAGGSLQREYPWGSTDPGTSSQYAIYECYYPSGSSQCNGANNIAPVGTATLGVGLWGQLDMTGEQQEWDFDFYAAYADPCTDCAYLSSASNRVIRSTNAYDEDAPSLISALRSSVTPAAHDDSISFRCARAP